MIADAKRLVVEGFRSLLEAYFEVTGIATDTGALLHLAREREPQAIVLNLFLPGLSGAELVRRLKAQAPGAVLIALGGNADPVSVREAFQLGAMAYVPKEAAPGELVRAIREALRGRRYVAAPAPQNGWDRESKAGGRRPGLTARQRQILALVAQGLSGKEIASRLGISPKTVEFHKAGIAERLGVRGTAELVRYALRRGLADDG